VLAPWQLGKHSRTSQENHQIESSLNTAPVPLKTLLPQQNSAAPGAQWRQVTATGHYLPDVQVLARLRVIDSKPAFEVLAPFVVDGGPTVLVNRGYVRPLEGSHVPPIPPPPTQTVTITARLRNSEPAALNKDPFVGDGVQQVYSIDTAQVAVLTRVPLAGSYLQLVDGQPGGLGVVGVPALDAGPFLSYGIQWIAFGILAPIGLGYFAYSEIQARRQEKQQRAAPAAETAPAPPAPQTVEAKLADRYGRRR
jgi:cytochrome oxidase assembly protein ShyY1